MIGDLEDVIESAVGGQNIETPAGAQIPLAQLAAIAGSVLRRAASPSRAA
jgi:hypothetical protein